MNQRSTITRTALVLFTLGAFAAEACSSDDDGGKGSGESDASTDAGAGGSQATGGKTGTGGSGNGGSATGGATGAEAGTEAGTPEAGTPEGGDAGDAGGPVCSYVPGGNTGDAGNPGDGGAVGPVVLVSGTDYTTTTEVVTVSLGTGQVIGRSTFSDGDAVPAASDGTAFVIERTAGALDVLTQAGTVERRILLENADASSGVNPRHVVKVPGSAPRKAYVSLYDGNAIAVVELDTGVVTKTIDLSGLRDPGDTDGSVDVDSGLFDTTTGRAYFSVERIDRNTINDKTSYHLTCPPVPAVVVAIDPATDSLVDLNGSDAGTAYSLALVSHSAMVQVPGTSTALLLAEGCFEAADGGGARAHHGIEALDLATGATEVRYAPTSGDYLAALELFGATSAAVQTADEFYTYFWHAWNTGSPTLGAELLCVPEGAVAAGSDALVGVIPHGTNWDVASYAPSTGTVVTVVHENVFDGAGLFATAGSALVK